MTSKPTTQIRSAASLIGLLVCALPLALLQAPGQAQAEPDRPGGSDLDWPLGAEFTVQDKDARGLDQVVKYRFVGQSWDAWTAEVLASHGSDPVASPDRAPGAKRSFDRVRGEERVTGPFGREDVWSRADLDAGVAVVPTLMFGPAVGTVPEGRTPAASRLGGEKATLAHRHGLNEAELSTTASTLVGECQDPTLCPTGTFETTVDAVHVKHLQLPLLVEVSVNGSLVHRVEVHRLWQGS